jgi:transposase
MLRLPSLGEPDRGLAARIYLSTTPTDMRKGFDSLAATVKDFLGQDPLSGHLFLFIGRARDRLKILYWDADGFAVWYKRLEEGTFRLPAARPGEAGVELKASELAMLLEGIDLRSLRRRKRLIRLRQVADAHVRRNRAVALQRGPTGEMHKGATGRLGRRRRR